MGLDGLRALITIPASPIPRRRVTGVKDGQQSALYKWEMGLSEAQAPDSLFNRDMGYDEVVELIARVWRDYLPGSTPPRVFFRYGGARSSYDPNRRLIKLLPKHHTARVVLHETAHALIDYMPQYRQEPDHGKVFARLLLDLWWKYAGLQLREVKHAAVTQRPRRVHFAKTGVGPACASRERQSWHDELVRLKKISEAAAKAVRDHMTTRPPV